MSARPGLTYRYDHLINFRHFDFPPGSHHGFRWVDIKRYTMPSGPAVDRAADRAVLAALIADPQFRDTYDGAGADSNSNRHGQWWLDRLAPSAYERVGARAATAVISSWATQHGSLPDELGASLMHEVYAPILMASSRYLLGRLPVQAMHDYGPVHVDFHELVLIDRESGSLLLIVAADD
ncbi:hypothetical protein [Pseudonocardia sp. GCM10023141]|uniref:hypothetical protein n=1 Tax=Pseudonocardia sp. GCM10023141 TaxID=3252653 RepID=UPI0036189F55